MHIRPIAWMLALSLAGAVRPAVADDFNFTMNMDGDKRVSSCDDIQMRFSRGRKGDDGIVTARRDKTVVLSAKDASPFRVRSDGRVGIHVQPSEDGSFSALVCMAAGAETQQAGDAILDQVQVESADGELSVNGPKPGNWGAYVVLSLPRSVALDLSAENGPLSLRDVSGQFTLRTINGPISLAGVSGQVNAEAVNGPIQFRGHAGDIRLAAQNGPVGVKLDAAAWTGKGLDASTQNGPVMLEAPTGLHAGVLVEGSEHSPFKLNGIARFPGGGEGGTRTLRMGDGPVLVRLSTVNGPVEIKGPRPSASRAKLEKI